jgi:3-deoxy-D-manno-octulosonic-acid transferase
MRTHSKRRELPITTRMAYFIYQIAYHLVLPLSGLFALWRARKEPGHLYHMSHRWGLGPVGVKGAVWIYAASLGEMNAARPLVQEFLNDGHHVLLTHLSPAGFDRGVQQFGSNPRVTHLYAPFDCFWTVQLFLRRTKPAFGIVLEIEIWPAMLIEADRLSIPMFMANGNLLMNRMKRLQTWRRHGLYLYRLFDHIFTRSQDYVERYIATGVRPENVSITGELRFDTKPDLALLDYGSDLRQTWNTTFTFMIASSVKGEEVILQKIVANFLQAVPQARVIWVPRSPQRFDAIADLLHSCEIPYTRRSQITDSIKSKNKVLIGDTLGEMDLYLGLADVVFVGASFTDMGGHNIIEPLSAGRPVIMGPSTYGIDFIARPAQQAGVFETFETPQAIYTHLLALSEDPQHIQLKQKKAKVFASLNSNTAKLTFEIISKHNSYTNGS